MGGNLATLLGATQSLDVFGWDGPNGARSSLRDGFGLVVLATHTGPWEAGATQLARMGLRPLVIVAPWPLLPRCERQVLRLRQRSGVATAVRGHRGWMQATRHLRGGGAVVVLVDSASAEVPGRRPLQFIGGTIAAPDAVVAWARRNGAALWAAIAEEAGYRLHVLTGAGAGGPAAGETNEAVAERGVGLFRDAVLRRPQHWAWIQPLATVLVGVTVGLSACAPIEALPPLPLDPEMWTAEVEEVEWSGPLRGEFFAELRASTMEGRWLAPGVDGRFRDVRLVLLRGSGEPVVGRIEAREGQGSWPAGPFLLRDARWTLSPELVPQLAQAQLQGFEQELGWTNSELRCGGCALEGIVWDDVVPEKTLGE